MDTKGEKQWGSGCSGVMNWVNGIEMYTLMCIKLMTNKNLLYQKIFFKFFSKALKTLKKKVFPWKE